MPDISKFRIQYEVQRRKLESELQKVEAALSEHERRVNLGMVSTMTDREIRGLNALSRQARETRLVRESLNKTVERGVAAKRRDYDAIVVGTRAYRNFGDALRRVTLWAGAGAVVYGFARITRAMFDATGQFQYFRKELQALGNEGEAVYNQLALTAIHAAQDTGRSWQEAADITKAWIRQGRSAAETADLLQTTLVGMIVTNMGATELIKALTAQLKAFDVQAENSIGLIDRLYAVSRKHAIEPAEVALGLQRFASAARETGVSIDEAYGLMVGTLAKTQQSAQMIGTSMRTILTRIFKPAAIDALQT